MQSYFLNSLNKDSIDKTETVVKFIFWLIPMLKTILTLLELQIYHRKIKIYEKLQGQRFLTYI